MKPKATPTWNRTFLELNWNYSICFESKETTRSPLQSRLYKSDGSSSQLVGIKNIYRADSEGQSLCVRSIYNRQCLTLHPALGASSVFTQQIPLAAPSRACAVTLAGQESLCLEGRALGLTCSPGTTSASKTSWPPAWWGRWESWTGTRCQSWPHLPLDTGCGGKTQVRD